MFPNAEFAIVSLKKVVEKFRIFRLLIFLQDLRFAPSGPQSPPKTLYSPRVPLVVFYKKSDF